jgi:acetyltransferase-like isoleucine patch superfamily enzyme
MFGKLKFWIYTQRIGPDMPLTHWMLYSKRMGAWLAKNKLKKFGEGSEIRPHAYLVECAHISIGDRVVIRPGCKFFAVPNTSSLGNITIKDNVLIGSDVHIYVSNHEFSDPDTDIYFQGHRMPEPVLIEHGAWIGAKAIILPGVTIGQNAVVGAGSIVTKSVPARTVVAGCPAKPVRTLHPKETSSTFGTAAKAPVHS